MVEARLASPTLFAFMVVTLAVGTVMLADVIKLRTHNVFWLLFSLSGLLFHSLGATGQGLQFSLVGAFLGFGLLFMPFLAGGIAARDLKLTAGVGAWFGPSLTIWVFVCIAAVATVYHVLGFLRRSSLRDAVACFRVWYCRLSCLLHYLATDDGSASRPEEVELDERLVSYTTAIFVSTLILFGLIIVFWT